MRPFNYEELNAKSKEELVRMVMILSNSYSDIENVVALRLDETKEAIQWRWNRDDNLQNRYVDAKKFGDEILMRSIDKKIHDNQIAFSRSEGERYELLQLRPLFLEDDEVEREAAKTDEQENV